MADYIDRQYAIEHYQHVCRRTNCKECPLHIQVTNTLTDCELELFLHNLPSAEITEKDLQEWCYKRGLTIIDNALYLEMKSRWSASLVMKGRRSDE